MQEHNEGLPVEKLDRENGPVKTSRWVSAAQLVFCIMAGLGFWGIALTLALLGGLANSKLPEVSTPGLSVDTGSVFLLAAALFWMGILVMPSAYYAGRRFARPEEEAPSKPLPIPLIPMIISLGVVIFTLWLGNTYDKERNFAIFILPFLHILAVSLPIFWTAFLTGSGLPPLPPRRAWGVFAASLTLGPIIIMLLEVLVMIFFMIAAVVFILFQPAWVEVISQIALRLSQTPNETVLERNILPYLVKPGVALPVLLYVAVFVPLIEEALKPIGVWLLLPSGLSGLQGFVIGLISGAGYALFESLLLATTAGDWMTVVIGRAATGLLHIANCGLVGWAVAEAFGSKPRPKGAIRRMWGAYFLAVALHGSWNGLTMFGLWANLAEKTGGENPDLLMQFGKAAPFGLVVITVCVICILWYENRRARQRLAQSLSLETPLDASNVG